MEKELPPQKENSLYSLYHAAVNLPQLPSAMFSDDPKSWRQFCCTFKAAVHLQNIPNIQELNYLISYLKRDALLTVDGYDKRL